MYGMVNKAVKALVVEQFGDAKWAEIRDRAGAPDDFVGLQAYDDAMTYGLVGAAVDVLGVPAEQILFGFGEYWVLRIATVTYADLMSATGSDMFSFLENVDAMHSRIKMTMPALNPPSFRVKRLDGQTIQVDYFSTREGLLPFVHGIIAGLSAHYAQPCSVTMVDNTASRVPSQRLLLTFV